MNENQIKYRNYLLRRLGFENNQYLNEYLNSLEKNLSIYEGYIAFDKNDNISYEWYNQDAVSGKFFPKKFTILDLLTWETNTKTKKNILKHESSIKNKYITASELSSFTYCPVSFSIQKTYIPPKNFLSIKGIELHNKHIINKMHQKVQKLKIEASQKNVDIENIDVFKKEFYESTDNYNHIRKEIALSEKIYFGHSNDEDDTNFINKNIKIVMKPDYIFKNNLNQYFVVEEKFKFYNEEIDFYQNDKVQIASYISFIEEYKINHGYLIYWFYKYKKSSISGYKILKIERSPELEIYMINLITRVEKFISNRKMDLKINYSAKKCARCSLTLICGHKNKKHSNLTLPYDEKYLDLF